MSDTTSADLPAAILALIDTSLHETIERIWREYTIPEFRSGVAELADPRHATSFVLTFAEFIVKSETAWKQSIAKGAVELQQKGIESFARLRSRDNAA